MNNMMKISRVVKQVLTDTPATRNSDPLLYAEVCKSINPAVKHWRFYDALTHLYELGIPSSETVTRARRRLQAEYPELRGNDQIEEMRTLREAEFIEYAKEDV